MSEKMKDGGQDTPKSSKKSTGRTVDLFAVQCGKCFKWRVIPTQEEFEDIRSRFIDDPFFCNKKPNCSCEDPPDLEYDSNRTWVIDKPNLPKTPKGFQRQLILRKDFSKLDAYYVTPTGKRVRSQSEVAAYLQENPVYNNVSPSDFNFNSPKVMEDTIPKNIERKVSASGHKKLKLLGDASNI